ncbi:MAG: hypothetical protein KF686_20175 [Ramlibacter sp.]|nr:hypothetical protein [Ramlibacter sp.]
MPERTPGPGAALARKALERLLARAENATAKGSADEGGSRAVALRLSPDSFPDYLKLGRHADKAECNTGLQLAERDGAIRIEWDPRAGELMQVERIVLRDGERLAQHLGVAPRWSVVAGAHRTFEPHLESAPVLAQVLEAWRKGNLARGTRPSEAGLWLDALRVVDHCRSRQGDDMAVRRLSASFFRDSKRIEALWPVIEALVLGDLAASPGAMEDVLSELGLVKYPSTLLIAGEMKIHCGPETIAVARPYLGVAPAAIDGIRVDGATTRFLLTVENLTTFHELAGRRPVGAIVLYTGGMPSPSWKRAYGHLLAALPAPARVYHWSDIDAGGFRIASHVAACCVAAGRPLRLHGMRADQALPGIVARRELGAAERREILRLCERWGWLDEAAALGSVATEQEAMEPIWPE